MKVIQTRCDSMLTYILIDDPFLDQCIDVYTVGGDQGREIIIHFKMYRNLVFLHD